MILQADKGGPFVIVPADVVRTIGNYVGDKTEAGGILLGRYRMPHIEIVTCSEPMTSDIRTFAGFDRRDRGHQLRALERWKDSGGTITFVGEWHSHPEESPSPSPLDLRTWREAQRSAGNLPLVFIIRGYTGWWFGLGTGRREPVQLSCVPSSAFDE